MTKIDIFRYKVRDSIVLTKMALRYISGIAGRSSVHFQAFEPRTIFLDLFSLLLITLMLQYC